MFWVRMSSPVFFFSRVTTVYYYDYAFFLVQRYVVCAQGMDMPLLFCSVLPFFFVPASFFTSAFSFLTLFISFFNPHALAIHPHPIHPLNATFLHSAQLSIKQNTALALKLI